MANIHARAEAEKRKALEQDPSIFDYDGVYDALKAREEARKPKKDTDQKPRYIHSLLKAAEERKKERERIQERKIQKERELEGDEFADKERFVTSAYKKRQEELKLEREAEKEKEAVEKTGDFTHFYRDYLDQRDRGLDDPLSLETAEEKGNSEKREEKPKGKLSAGLNIRKKPQQAPTSSSYPSEDRYRSLHPSSSTQRRTDDVIKAREYILEQKRKRDEELEKKRRERLQQLELKMARHTDDKSAKNARERYLARKKQQSESSDSD